MRIYCPKCYAGYEINERLIADKSRKVACCNCGEVFVADELLFDIGFAGKTEDEQFAFEQLHEAMVTEENVVATKQMDEDGPIAEAAETTDEKSFDTIVEETVPEMSNAESDEKNIAGETAQDVGPADEKDEDAAGADEEESVDLEKIFERLSEHTSRLLAEEKKLPFYEKIWLQIKNILGFHFKIKWIYVTIFVLVFVSLSLFNNRYQIVRELPFLNAVYRAFGIKAKIPGEGLEFQNINWEFLEEGKDSRLEIKGFVYNQTDKDIDIPTVHVEILDKDTVLLQSQNRKIEETSAGPQEKIPLNLAIDSPAPTAKYVYLTFIDEN